MSPVKNVTTADDGIGADGPSHHHRQQQEEEEPTRESWKRDENDTALLIDTARRKAEKILSALDSTENEKDSELDDNGESIMYKSWVRGEVEIDKSSWLSEDEYPTRRCRFLDRHGFVLVKGFADSKTEVEAMKNQMEKLAREQWDTSPSNKTATFRTDEKQVDAQGSDDYFLDSASKVHFFAEKDAMDDNGNLKEEFQNYKMAALNKAGHGMHMIPGPFYDYTTSTKVKKLVKELGWVDPVVPQSMYIFKQARVGGEVTSHQDSTFLFTTPKQSCLGLWLALDDATLENGCLWVRPGSHNEAVRRKFVRNPQHFGNIELNLVADKSKPQMIFEYVGDSHDEAVRDVPWDGKLPPRSDAPPWEGLFQMGFVPVECAAGDLLAFVGELDHLSLPNHSKTQRHTFQLHLVEGPSTGVEWAKSNWLQYPEGIKFLSIKDDN